MVELVDIDNDLDEVAGAIYNIMETGHSKFHKYTVEYLVDQELSEEKKILDRNLKDRTISEIIAFFDDIYIGHEASRESTLALYVFDHSADVSDDIKLKGLESVASRVSGLPISIDREKFYDKLTQLHNQKNLEEAVDRLLETNYYILEEIIEAADKTNIAKEEVHDMSPKS